MERGRHEPAGGGRYVAGEIATAPRTRRNPEWAASGSAELAEAVSASVAHWGPQPFLPVMRMLPAFLPSPVLVRFRGGARQKHRRRPRGGPAAPPCPPVPAARGARAARP